MFSIKLIRISLQKLIFFVKTGIWLRKWKFFWKRVGIFQNEPNLKNLVLGVTKRIASASPLPPTPWVTVKNAQVCVFTCFFFTGGKFQILFLRICRKRIDFSTVPLYFELEKIPLWKIKLQFKLYRLETLKRIRSFDILSTSLHVSRL